MGSSADWAPVAQNLDSGRRCFCPDLPGHGACPVNAGADMAATSKMLFRELDKHGIEKCALVGYSMGGRVALHLAIQRPERFSSLILESASPGIADPQARLERRKQDEELAGKLVRLYQHEAGFYDFLDAWYRQPLFDTWSESPALMQRVIARRLHNDPRALAAALLGLGVGAQPSLWTRLSAMELPVLLITGTKDSKFTAIAEAMTDVLPCARHERFQACSHCVHEETPEQFASVVERFLHETRA